MIECGSFDTDQLPRPQLNSLRPCKSSSGHARRPTRPRAASHSSWMRLLRSALLRPALQHARLCSAGKGGPPAQPKPAVKQAAQHAVATSTHFFRISNPEAFMDPNKRVSWIITGVVAAFLAARFGYALYQDDGKLFEPTPAPAPTDVAKTLPDGRWLAVLTRAPRHSRAVPTVRAGGGVPASCVPPVGRVRTPAAQGSSCVRTRAHAYAHGPTRTYATLAARSAASSRVGARGSAASGVAYRAAYSDPTGGS